jgi:hypothetical protein
LTKNIFRGVNFTNLKTPDGYIAKSKPLEFVYNQAKPMGDYAIWPNLKFKKNRHQLLACLVRFSSSTN